MPKDIAKQIAPLTIPWSEICICQSASQVVEYQQMAKAHKFDKRLILVCVALDGDIPVPGGSLKMLPIVGNLALVQARVACLSGEPCAALRSLEPKEIKIENEDNNLSVLRITAVINYLPHRAIANIRVNPIIVCA